MGVSTDAILFFGVVLPDSESEDFVPDPWEGGPHDGWEEALAATQGVLPPTVPFSDETRAEYKAYWERKSTVVGAFGCTVGIHCSDDYPMQYVALKHREITANRGYAQAIDPANLAVLDRDREKVELFLETIGYTREQFARWRIGWWLVSYWG
jgi:hypothetical protein